MGTIIIDISTLFAGTAKIEDIPGYVGKCIHLAGEGNEIVLTGKGPVWLYLTVAHALHGKARRLVYRSPVTGDLVIFNHDPF